MLKVSLFAALCTLPNNATTREYLLKANPGDDPILCGTGGEGKAVGA